MRNSGNQNSFRGSFGGIISDPFSGPKCTILYKHTLGISLSEIQFFRGSLNGDFNVTLKGLIRFDVVSRRYDSLET